jgi:DNA-binding LacI/PurR family transcriptional regulator
LTIRDVASFAGCSTATVSRALNSPDKVDPQTLQAVRAAIRTTGYRPSALGRMLRAGQSRVIGVVIPTIANPVFGETLQGIDEYATQAGYRLMLMTTEYEHERERLAIDTLREHRVDGLILTVSDAVTNPHLDQLDQAGIPYVLAHNDARSASGGRMSVSVNNFTAARDGVRQMLAFGHRRISMLAGTLAASDRAQQRVAGYAAAMREAGLTPGPVIEATFTAERLNAAALHALTAGDKRPSALFCSNDRLAMIAIMALNEADVVVPSSMSVMGFDGLSEGKWCSPVLTTICVPNREIGRQAWRCLQHTIEHRSHADAVHLDHTIRLGGTLTPIF